MSLSKPNQNYAKVIQQHSMSCDGSTHAFDPEAVSYQLAKGLPGARFNSQTFVPPLVRSLCSKNHQQCTMTPQEPAHTLIPCPAMVEPDPHGTPRQEHVRVPSTPMVEQSWVQQPRPDNEREQRSRKGDGATSNCH